MTCRRTHTGCRRATPVVSSCEPSSTTTTLAYPTQSDRKVRARRSPSLYAGTITQMSWLAAEGPAPIWGPLRTLAFARVGRIRYLGWWIILLTRDIVDPANHSRVLATLLQRKDRTCSRRRLAMASYGHRSKRNRGTCTEGLNSSRRTTKSTRQRLIRAASPSGLRLPVQPNGAICLREGRAPSSNRL